MLTKKLQCIYLANNNNNLQVGLNKGPLVISALMSPAQRSQAVLFQSKLEAMVLLDLFSSFLYKPWLPTFYY